MDNQRIFLNYSTIQYNQDECILQSKHANCRFYLCKLLFCCLLILCLVQMKLKLEHQKKVIVVLLSLLAAVLRVRLQTRTKARKKPHYLALLYQSGYDEMDRKGLAMG